MRNLAIVSVLFAAIVGLAWELFQEKSNTQAKQQELANLQGYTRDLEVRILSLEQELAEAKSNSIEAKLQRTSEQLKQGLGYLADKMHDELSDAKNAITGEQEQPSSNPDNI